MGMGYGRGNKVIYTKENGSKTKSMGKGFTMMEVASGTMMACGVITTKVEAAERSMKMVEYIQDNLTIILNMEKVCK